VQPSPKDQKNSLTYLTSSYESPAQMTVTFQTLKYIPPVSCAPRSMIHIEKLARTQVLSRSISQCCCIQTKANPRRQTHRNSCTTPVKLIYSYLGLQTALYKLWAQTWSPGSTAGAQSLHSTLH